MTDAEVLYVSARPQGGSWRTLGTIEFPLDDGHSADGSLRYGQLTVGDVELRVWQGRWRPAVDLRSPPGTSTASGSRSARWRSTTA